MKQLLPWQELLRFGLGTLRLSPDDFWRMTPLELAAAMQGANQSAAGHHNPSAATMSISPLNRDDLCRLMQAHPDRKANSHARA